jgi:flagellar motility protein MotE (MotC chaperone)
MAYDKPQIEAEEPKEEPKKKSGGKFFLWLGVFFVSMTLVNAAMFFFVRNRKEKTVSEVAELSGDSLVVAVADSLVQKPDSLELLVEELKGMVTQKDAELVQLQDSSREINSRYDEMKIELENYQQKEIELSDAEIGRLSRVFQAMQPRRAAPIMMKMDNSSVAAILLSIKERTAAKIMASMPPDRSAAISFLIRERAKTKSRQQKID